MMHNLLWLLCRMAIITYSPPHHTGLLLPPQPEVCPWMSGPFSYANPDLFKATGLNTLTGISKMQTLLLK